jgi:hypothetical protein
MPSSNSAGLPVALRALLGIAALAVGVAADERGATAPAAAEELAEASAESWKPLFNGKDLDGWRVKIRGYEAGNNFAETFRVADGCLTVAYDGYERFENRFGHIFYEHPYSNYRLRVEYRFIGEQVPGGPGWALRNSGVMIHGQTPDSMTLEQEFPASIEVQLLGGGDTGERTTANLCTPGTNVVMDGTLITRHCTNSKSKTFRGDRWVSAELEVIGNKIRHIVEGDTVLEYTDPQLDERDADAKRLLAAGSEKLLRGGTISLQSESHPVQFRKVEILLLDDKGDPLPVEPEWTQLLAGAELGKHWETKGNWTLDKEGVVSLTPRPGEEGWDRFDAYLWSKEDYEDFEIEFEYRLERNGNSGFYLHVGDRASPVATGIEVQIYDSHGKPADARLSDHDSGGIIPGIAPTKNTAKPAGDWNLVRVTSRGSELSVALNGEVVNVLALDHPRISDRPRKGRIGFQDHALPIALRGVRIRRL